MLIQNINKNNSEFCENLNTNFMSRLLDTRGKTDGNKMLFLWKYHGLFQEPLDQTGMFVVILMYIL